MWAQNHLTRIRAQWEKCRLQHTQARVWNLSQHSLALGPGVSPSGSLCTGYLLIFENEGNNMWHRSYSESHTCKWSLCPGFWHQNMLVHLFLDWEDYYKLFIYESPGIKTTLVFWVIRQLNDMCMLNYNFIPLNWVPIFFLRRDISYNILFSSKIFFLAIRYILIILYIIKIPGMITPKIYYKDLQNYHFSYN